MKCHFLPAISFFYISCVDHLSWAFSTKAVVSRIPRKVPFNNAGVDLNRSVTFNLYTRDHPHDPRALYVGDRFALNSSDFNSSLPTTLVTHGWRSSCLEPVCILIQNGFLQHGRYNVIRVDWSYIANSRYTRSASRIQIIGSYVAAMIDFLVSEGTNPKRITLVGHSLGAHVIGLAGFFAKTRLPHVVGLDPAMPGFTDHGTDGRISRSDADLVEIVHTNAGVLGFNYSVGHLDFYPNGGGPEQPGCFTEFCSHKRSYYYYSESLMKPRRWYGVKCPNQTEFEARRCENNAVAPFPRWYPDFPRPKGDYNLRTASYEPYGLGLNGTRPANETSLTSLL